jgi:lipoprotein NlpD
MGVRRSRSRRAWSTPPLRRARHPPRLRAGSVSGSGLRRASVVAGYNEASNKGLDIGGKVGDPVYAAAAGKVVYAGSGLRGYGKLIVIKHNQEYNSVYAHNDKLLVKEDDQVVAGAEDRRARQFGIRSAQAAFRDPQAGQGGRPDGYLPAR